MLHEFLTTNRDQLIFRCREKVASRPVPPPTELELRHGIPLFLGQLTDALRENARRRLHESVQGAPATVVIRKPVGTTDIDSTAGAHGNELLLKGYTVDQVVHDYGDLCQAVTELALEQNAPITTDEFRTLNGCLDNAIADAVTAFERQRDEFMAEANTEAMNLRLGFLAHELRNLTTNAILAVAAIKRGHVGVAGATGAMLDRTLIRLRDLVDRALVEVRLTAGSPQRRERIGVSKFIEEVSAVAAMEAQAQGIQLTVVPTGEGLAVDADPQILAGAVANLLQNAFKFTKPQGRIVLKAYSAADRILIEVEDECGGLVVGKTEEMFRPFEQSSAQRAGLGLGLAISRRGIEANGGELRVRDLPGVGCVFTVDLPPSPN
jgi:signal transduction histidine kinase